MTVDYYFGLFWVGSLEDIFLYKGFIFFIYTFSFFFYSSLFIVVKVSNFSSLLVLGLTAPPFRIKRALPLLY